MKLLKWDKYDNKKIIKLDWSIGWYKLSIKFWSIIESFLFESKAEFQNIYIFYKIFNTLSLQKYHQNIGFNHSVFNGADENFQKVFMFISFQSDCIINIGTKFYEKKFIRALFLS